ncbi:Tll0287-like domain-containing protein [Botryobacter ruber]|uniref:Tll0287-like domain-containing protein n=1 Tax=Botryobacter ruber TaxID=2171629 RepID=UPI001F0C2E0D|nr:DUF3365 domain-containing protein [Botryobacter ruber]
MNKMFCQRILLSAITFIIVLIVSGCDVKVKPIEGGKEIAQELERHKIKRVTRPQILAATRKAGDSIATVAMQEVGKLLQEKLQEGGVEAALPYCPPENFPAINALEEKYGATARRTSSKLRNPANKADERVTALLQQYEQGELKEPQVVELNEQEMLYTAPIYIRSETCLRCHGTLGQEVATEEYQVLKERYPTDEATGYKLGDLRGMWYIHFTKKGIVTDLNAQPRKSRIPKGL